MFLGEANAAPVDMSTTALCFNIVPKLTPNVCFYIVSVLGVLIISVDAAFKVRVRGIYVM